MLNWLKSKLGIPKEQPLKLEDEVGIHGKVEIHVRDKDGKLIFEEKDDNVVLTQGKYEIMKMLRNNAAREILGTPRSICRLVVGDGGCPSSDLFTPKTLDKSRTALFYPVHIRDITSSSHPTGDALEIIVDILSDDLIVGDFNPANAGEYLNEAALVSSIPGTYVAGKPGDPGVDSASEVEITHKTFKSFPFTPGQTITATIKWTLFIVL